jgi:hypothetical protein
VLVIQKLLRDDVAAMKFDAVYPTETPRSVCGQNHVCWYVVYWRDASVH